MFRRGSFIERDRHGGERIVIRTRRRSSSSSLHHREDLRDILDAAEEREQALLSENERLENDIRRLRRELEISQRNEWKADYKLLRQEHTRCSELKEKLESKETELVRTKLKLEKEVEKNEKLEERIRLLRRSSGFIDRDQYNEKIEEIEKLRTKLKERDEKIAKEERNVLYLKGYLRDLGYRVTVPL
ncbi:hypothetical protein F5884DRAFT_747943 [Xylogone sp. PMI_703]|nr:hypothetical protein F5884DRAFT_747943 [Xylogone sp. PMI_703]